MSLLDGLEFIDQIALRHKSGECLVWPYKIDNRSGYGALTGTLRAHVYTCYRAHGPRPHEKNVVAHTCGVRSCVNPLHLRWTTQAQNLIDRHLHGTAPTGELGPGAKLTNAQAAAIRASTEKRRILAERYHVSVSIIGRIKRGERYRAE